MQLVACNIRLKWAMLNHVNKAGWHRRGRLTCNRFQDELMVVRHRRGAAVVGPFDLLSESTDFSSDHAAGRSQVFHRLLHRRRVPSRTFNGLLTPRHPATKPKDSCAMGPSLLSMVRCMEHSTFTKTYAPTRCCPRAQRKPSFCVPTNRCAMRGAHQQNMQRGEAATLRSIGHVCASHITVHFEFCCTGEELLRLQTKHPT